MKGNVLNPYILLHWLRLLTMGALLGILSPSAYAEVSSVSVIANPTNTQVTGMPVDFTASSVATGPVEYQFGVKRQGDPQAQLARDWGGPQWQWATNGLSEGIYIFEVRARSVGNPVAFEAIIWTGYQLVTLLPVSSVNLSAEPPLQQVEGGSVVFIADAVTTGNPEFQYLVKGPTDTEYQLVRDWGPALWEISTAGAPTGNYVIQVRARNVGSMASYEAVTWLGHTLLSEAPSGLDNRPTNSTCLASAEAPVNDRIAAVFAFPNLQYPVDLEVLTSLVQSPNDPTRWYALEKAGRIFSFSSSGGSLVTTVLDMRGAIDTQGEGGMLGIAFHPDPADGRVFLFFTRPGNPQVSYVSSFLSTDGGATLNPATEKVIGLLDQPSTVHKAGQMNFGPDGYLYVSIGDGGKNGAANAQDTNNLYGTLLRLDVDKGNPYAIPTDNPFAGGGGLPEIYAWGFRNPWRWSFDSLTGDLWLGDVGQSKWEEINKIVAGGNYGWGLREGAHCYPPDIVTCQTEGLIDPFVEYSHDEGIAVIGGYVYRGNAMPELDGIYLYADLFGKVWGIFKDANGNPDPQLLIDVGLQGSIFSMAQDKDGEIYLLLPGQAMKLVPQPTGGPPPEEFPQKLSETGCMLAADPTQPVTGMIPYDVNIELWTDGAGKDRWMALPDGETISYTPDGDVHFPIGSVFVKNFALGGKLIETRLFMRHLDGNWGGYSYEWNAAGTDADLLSEGKTININGQDYTYPSRTQCLRCHTPAAGFTLGPDIFQLNRDITYPSTGRTANQLVTFQSLGLFDPPLPAPQPQNLPALPEILDSSASLDVRARGYLHSNCSYCHQPGGGGRGPADFRYSLTGSLASMNICDVIPEVGDLSVANARLLAPGDPSRSIIAVRMRRLDGSTMPPVGHHVVDSDGLTLISAWIGSITACP